MQYVHRYLHYVGTTWFSCPNVHTTQQQGRRKLRERQQEDRPKRKLKWEREKAEENLFRTYPHPNYPLLPLSVFSIFIKLDEDRYMWSPYPFLITETMDKYLLALCDTSLVGHAILPLSLYIVNDSASFITAARTFSFNRSSCL